MHASIGSKLLFLFGIAFSYAVLCYSQTNLRFRQYSLTEGLSQSCIYDILQDRQGFLWLGTQDGLNRFDGYHFRVFKHEPENPYSLPDSWVDALLEDDRGGIWVATRKGVARFDPKTERFERFSPTQERSDIPSGNVVFALHRDKLGRLWIGSFNGGLSMLEMPGKAVPGKVRFQQFSETPHETQEQKAHVVSLESTQKHLFIGTFGAGLARMQFNEPDIRDYFLNETGNGRSLSNNAILVLYFDSKERLWVGTRHGLNLFHNESSDFSRFFPNPTEGEGVGVNTIHAISEDDHGRLWLGTRGGLVRFNVDQGNFEIYPAEPDSSTGLPHNEIRSIFKDRYHTQWFGTFGGGLCQLEPFSEVFKNYRTRTHGLSHAQVWSILTTSHEDLWVATEQGLNRLKKGEQRFQQFHFSGGSPNTLKHPTVKSLLEPLPGTLWVGTRNGLNFIDLDTEEISSLILDIETSKGPDKDIIWAMEKDASGGVWLAGELGGLTYIHQADDPSAFTRYDHQPGSHMGPSDKWTTCLEIDDQGYLWVGTHDSGLDRIHVERIDEGFENISYNPKRSTSLRSNTVFDTYIDKRQRLWVGTSGGGLNLGDARNPGNFQAYTLEDGLPNEVIYSILEDKRGDLWLSTNNGLACFNPEQETFLAYDVGDGLQSNEFNAGAFHRDSQGNLYFGGIDGLTQFDSLALKQTAAPADIVIDRVHLFNKPLAVNPDQEPGTGRLREAPSYANRLVLGHKDYVFSFDLVSLHYANQKKNRIAYKLEGLDKNWIEVSIKKRFASYANVSPGRYTLRVKGSGFDGKFSDQEARLSVEIMPAPWLTWWAKGLYGLFIIALLVSLFKLHRHKLTNERQLNQRLREIDRMRDEFMASTSHELRTPLGGMIGLAESLMDGATGDLSAKTRHHLAMIVRSGKRLANLVDDILDFSRLRDTTPKLTLQPLDLYTIVDVVFTLSRSNLGGKKVDLENKVPADFPTVYADEDRLQQVLYNLIGNAIKFTEEGFVTVKSQKKDSYVVISVTDTGIGIPPSQQEEIFASFVQLDGADTRNYGGTGLGLAITKKLVELHGGRVWVGSDSGQGATFSFTLPLAKEKMTPLRREKKAVLDALYQETSPLVHEDQSATSPFHILIVDDEPVNRQVLWNHLSLHYAKLTQVSDGQQAGSIVATGDVDLVLLDIMMPKKSGFEVCEEIRRSFPLHKLPVIFLSARNRVVDLAKAFSAGGNDYLTKPILKEELLARVEMHLHLVQSGRDLDERNRLLREKSEKLLRLEEERMKSLRTLTAGVAHEINNATNFSKGSAENLSVRINQLERFLLSVADEEAEEEILEHFTDLLKAMRSDLEIVAKGQQRTISVIKDLHTFTRASGATREFVSLSKNISSVIALTRPSYPDIQFETQFEDTLEMECHALELNQVFLHILTNACDAIEEGRQGVVRVKVVKEKKWGVISIADNGCGMTPTVRDKVFDPFFSTKEVGIGTGLGLSIAYGIIRSHEGRIDITSQAGKGSTFVIRLPLAPIWK